MPRRARWPTFWGLDWAGRMVELEFSVASVGGGEFGAEASEFGPEAVVVLQRGAQAGPE